MPITILIPPRLPDTVAEVLQACGRALNKRIRKHHPDVPDALYPTITAVKNSMGWDITFQKEPGYSSGHPLGLFRKKDGFRSVQHHRLGYLAPDTLAERFVEDLRGKIPAGYFDADENTIPPLDSCRNWCLIGMAAGISSVDIELSNHDGFYWIHWLSLDKQGLRHQGLNKPVSVAWVLRVLHVAHVGTAGRWHAQFAPRPGCRRTSLGQGYLTLPDDPITAWDHIQGES